VLKQMTEKALGGVIERARLFALEPWSDAPRWRLALDAAKPCAGFCRRAATHRYSVALLPSKPRCLTSAHRRDRSAAHPASAVQDRWESTNKGVTCGRRPVLNSPHAYDDLRGDLSWRQAGLPKAQNFRQTDVLRCGTACALAQNQTYVRKRFQVVPKETSSGSRQALDAEGGTPEWTTDIRGDGIFLAEAFLCVCGFVRLR